jgi:phosphohistidine phosphatase
MALYLVQHGKSYSKEEDTEKKLTNTGAVEVKKMADAAALCNVKVSSIIHSGKKRALQTAVILAISLDVSDVIEAEGMNPNDEIESFVKNNDLGENMMIVGHLPFMEKLAAYLVTGNAAQPIIKFQNGGIVCFDQYEDRWMIKWVLNPQIN